MQIRLILCAGALLLSASTVLGQTQQPADLDSRMKALEEQVRALQAELATLRAGGAVPQTPAGPPTAPAPLSGLGTQPAAALPVYGAAQAGSKIFNPDIGMIGNFLGAVGKSKGGSEALAPTPLTTLQESEASFQAIVDPYARADFFLALGEEGIEVEEGYVSFPTLPGGLLIKAGKMRANFGRLNAFHNHTLPWIDRPLVMYNLLGGSPGDPDTGIKDAGFSVSRLIPASVLAPSLRRRRPRGQRAPFSGLVHHRCARRAPVLTQ